MPLDREITRPMLGTDQEPTSRTWKSSLRSTSPSPRSSRQSRSRTRSNDLLKSSLRSRTPSPHTAQSLDLSASNLRKSTSGKLSVKLNKSAELKEIESDYVKNLQQQIYFLELEANYLREQAKKATDMHPQMTAEAERMLKKLRSLQNEVDGLQIEVRRKEASIQLITNEKSKCLARLAEQENQKEKMKRTLLDEIDVIKSERDMVTLDNTRLENQVDRLMSEKDSVTAKLRDSQNTAVLLRGQLDEKSEQYTTTKLNLEEKRAQCTDAELRARDIEDHYLNKTQLDHQREVSQLRGEVNVMQQRLKETEREVTDERFIKNKTNVENADLQRTNLQLNQQIDELRLQLRRADETRKSLEVDRSKDLAQITMLSGNEQELKIDIDNVEQKLMSEKERTNQYLLQLKRQEETNAELDLSMSALDQRLANAESKITTLEVDNQSLRRDKEILTDHVADLQKQLMYKDGELNDSRSRIRNLQDDLNVVETERRVDESLQTDKWREFEALADGMKNLSRSMTRTGSPTRSPRSSVRLS